MVALLVFAIIIVIIGGLSLTQATLGVGLVGIACFLGVLARLAQADSQVRKLQEEMADIQGRLRHIQLGAEEEEGTE